MAKYLFEATYRPDGTRGLQQEGGSSRPAALREMIEGLGGQVECFYYTFGKSDAFVIADIPDNVTAAAISIAINASGTVGLSTTVLITPEEIDKAVKVSVNYRPPGKKA
jgi:uncharacterized protein with GYD domain